MNKSEMPLRVIVRGNDNVRMSELNVGDAFLMFEAESEIPMGTYIANSEPTLLNDVWSIQVNIKESV